MKCMDLMNAWNKTHDELQEDYNHYFSLKFLNTSFSNKMCLLSLVCFITKKAREKKPEATCLQVLKKFAGERDLNSRVAIICEDLLKDRDQNFPLFNFKSSKEMIDKINEIMDTYLPFDYWDKPSF